MKVLFDTQIFDWQINGGISRYFIEALNRLDKDREVEVLFRCRHSYNTYIQDTRWLGWKPVLKKLQFKGKLSALKLVNQQINRPYSNRLLRKGVAGIFHPTYYDPYFLKYLGHTPLVLTVYDLTNEKFNDRSSLTEKVLGWKRQLIERANHIIAISDNTRKDVIEYYGVAPEKVTTVYLSGGFDAGVMQAPPDAAMEKLPQRYILFVGSRQGYKNYAAFVREVAPVMLEQDISLVAAGGGPMSAAEKGLLQELSIADKVTAFAHVSDGLLAQLYKRAAVFVFPSLYEGFGLPVLEAMQCGCPALLSNNSSLPEVGGEAAEYFDPQVPGSLYSTIIKLLQDEEKRRQMIVAGATQVTKFNWENTAKGHTEVYKKMLS
ncbi:MAG TPA: glycosyltransferase family 1 protein [Chitinophagaceae bacterium]|jgi:glycosyltransferase involved in cell wall biosynthesis|nr:glycosyltransferase family 1 protein [Chitinophagaceae bacterium]HMU59989.1 glycosyltransferase family 1 protein [Chitinophagaceae bacterium]